MYNVIKVYEDIKDNNIYTGPECFNEYLRSEVKGFKLYLLADKGLSISTTKVYMRMLKKVIKDIGKINPTHKDFRQYIADMRYSDYSHSYTSNLCLIIEIYTEKQGNTLVLKRGRKPKPVLKDTLTEGEISVIIAACSNLREKALISLLAYSGIRNDELCSLKVSDFDPYGRKIIVRCGKGKIGRVARISGSCASDVSEYLREYKRDESSYLFTSLRYNNKCVGATVRRLIKRVVARTNVRKNVYPHLFRHSLATNMLVRGAGLMTIKDQLGHRFVDTTMLYLRSDRRRSEAEYEMYCPSYS